MKYCIVCKKITIPFWRATSKDKKWSMHYMCYWRFITLQLNDIELQSVLDEMIKEC